MTIGIPKIPVTFIDSEDGNKRTSWIDIYEGLFNKRVVFLFGSIDSDTMIEVVSLLLALNDEGRKVYIYINSPGGDARKGITIYDTMKAIMPDVATYVMGKAESSASLILAGGKPGKRLAAPHARIKIDQPLADPFSGPTHTTVLQAEQILELRNKIADIYADITGKPLSVIQQDMERGTYMSAEEARDYGIIDYIPPTRRRRHLEEDSKGAD